MLLVDQVAGPHRLAKEDFKEQSEQPGDDSTDAPFSWRSGLGGRRFGGRLAGIRQVGDVPLQVDSAARARDSFGVQVSGAGRALHLLELRMLARERRRTLGTVCKVQDSRANWVLVGLGVRVCRETQ